MERALILACEFLYNAVGECPMYIDDYLAESICVEDKCSMNDDSKPVGCWKRYFIERAKNEENEKV